MAPAAKSKKTKGKRVVRRTKPTGKAVRVIGSRAQVFHGTAVKTVGGLRRTHLKRAHGRIVSRKVSAQAKKSKGYKALLKGGWVVRKGTKPLLGRRRKGVKVRKA